MTPILLNENDGRFYVGDSTLPGLGQGLFAKVPLREGERLEVIGVLVLANSESDRCTHYADKHKFRVGNRLLIPLGYGGIANHSATPNLEKIFEGERVYLRLLRDVESGEELFHAYSDYAQDHFVFR